MMDGRVRVSVVQMCSGGDIAANLARAEALMAAAVAEGGELVVFPENVAFMGPEGARRAAETALAGEVVQHFQVLARRWSRWVLLGSFAEAAADGGKGYNTSVLIGADGEVVGRYRKLHLFDVETPEGAVLRESDGMRAGDGVVVLQAGAWRCGLSICYDLRFPELYRRVVGAGAEVLLVPAAFTAETGRDHWSLLLRARAVENQAYVVAANQWGLHFGQRASYGRSMIVDPWGVIVAQVADGEGVATGVMDLGSLRSLRRRFPCLAHRRRDLLGDGV